MNTKGVLSPKGQLITPKPLRSKLGLHSGSEIAIELKRNNIIELRPLRKGINRFFGLGKNEFNKRMSIEEMDMAISKAVIDNDKS
ncbi:MAG: AbrB/MazE/SpoVT family DNA-binding domain-containing protein [Rickettsiales bacterium]|nr:AbrB/MazE/SpoVT family DNA-binding domain-containing protein [Rickettsiales bacterium]